MMRLNLPNINIFKEQIGLLRHLLMSCPPSKEQAKDIDFLLSLGELFTLVAYGQLIIEEAGLEKLDKEVLDQIFDFMIRDFSKFALQLSQKSGVTEEQSALCMKMIKNPARDLERYRRVWDNHIAPLVDAFEQNP